MVALNPDFLASSLASEEPVDVSPLEVRIAGQVPGAQGAFNRADRVGGFTEDGDLGRDLGVISERLNVPIDPRLDTNTLRGAFFSGGRMGIEAAVSVADQAVEAADTLEHGAESIPGVQKLGL